MTHATPDDLATYCRDVEAYLCRKNDGHLIRIVGPAFEQVCGWAARGVPLKAVFRGIDRYFARYYAKGSRRRPIRVEFCEADVFDVFDEWRRAVGVTGFSGTGKANSTTEEAVVRKRGSLPAHLDRVLMLLTNMHSGEHRTLDDVAAAIVRELDVARASVRRLRGDARGAFVDRLRELDARLIEAARGISDADALSQLASEADLELAPFRLRMPRESYDHARQICIDRLIRDLYRLPALIFD